MICKILTDIENLQKILTKIVIFWKNRPKIKKIAKIFNQNFIFKHFWPKSKYFGNFDQNREFLSFFLPNRNFSGILIKVEIFENFNQNRYFRIFGPKSTFFGKFCPKSTFLDIMSIINIYENFYQNRIFAKILTKIENFKSFDHYRNFS